MNTRCLRIIITTNIALSVLALLLVACTSKQAKVRGLVSTIPERTNLPTHLAGDIYETGKPVAEANVLLTCAKRAVQVIARTDPEGRFYFTAPEPLPRTCMIRISKNGYRVQTFEVGPLCAKTTAGKRCGAIHVYAELVPTTP